MIYSKTIPVGMDVRLNRLQVKLESVFLALGLITGQFDLYGRIYRLKEDTGIKPVKFVSKEFSKSLFSTDKALVSYFYEKSDIMYQNGLFTVTLGQIVHANLVTLFPLITTRADQEFTKILTDLYWKEPYGFKLIDYVIGLDRVFADFSYDSRVEDLQPYFTLRIDLNLNFRI